MPELPGNIGRRMLDLITLGAHKGPNHAVMERMSAQDEEVPITQSGQFSGDNSSHILVVNKWKWKTKIRGCRPRAAQPFNYHNNHQRLSMMGLDGRLKNI